MRSKRRLSNLFRILSATTLLLAVTFAMDKARSVVGPATVVILCLLTVMTAGAWATARAIDRHGGASHLRGWLACGAALVAFVVCDLVVCCTLRPREGGPRMLADNRLHHRLAPNQETKVEHSDFTYTIRTNSRGLRGPEVAMPKPRGTVRILFLGDSFTMGKGVEHDETYPVVTASLLSRGTPARRVEAVNAGVDSYAPVLSSLQVEGLLDLDIDHVVHAVDMSDLMQEQAYRGLALPGPDGSIAAVPAGKLAEAGGVASWSQAVADWIIDNMYFSGSLLASQRHKSAFSVHNLVRTANPALLAHTLAHDSTERESQWQDLFDSIQRIAASCRARGVQYTLVTYPWGHQVSDREWRVGRRAFVPDGAVIYDRVRTEIATRARNAAVTLLDSFDAFRAYDGKAALYFNHDLHWTPTGHAVMAEFLAKRLPL